MNSLLSLFCMFKNDKKWEMNNDKNSTRRRSEAIAVPSTGGCNSCRPNNLSTG